MEDATLYAKTNHVPLRDATMCLDEYSSKFKWRKYNRILDIGCGDGSVTNILKKYIPKDFKLVGCDICEKMVNFANNQYCNNQTSFMVLDIGEDLPEGMKEKFNHVFSSFTLHWVKNQERVFNNIYNLMDSGGECFLIIQGTSPIYDVYRRLARNNRWSTLLKDAEKYVSPYHNIQEPIKKIRRIMDLVGFVDVHVESKDLTYVYENIHILKATMKAIIPFKIPEESFDDFLQDYVEVLDEMQVIDKSNYSAKYNYSLLVVYARKQPSQDKY